MYWLVISSSCYVGVQDYREPQSCLSGTLGRVSSIVFGPGFDSKTLCRQLQGVLGQFKTNYISLSKHH